MAIKKHEDMWDVSSGGASGIDLDGYVSELLGTGDKRAKQEQKVKEKGEKWENLRVQFEEIELDKIIPRSINEYKQSRIERLAKSIRNTNDRLIHPITVARIKDLEGSEVMAKFKEQGTDLAGKEYVIVSGERRYRAFCYLLNEALNNPLSLDSEKFKTITCNILKPDEAKNENVFYEDSNTQSRQLTPGEVMSHIRSAMEEVLDVAQKREALSDMGEDIPEDDKDVEKKFRKDSYCSYYLETELGIEGMNDSSIRNHLAVLNNCEKEIVDAIIAGDFVLGAASKITKFTRDEQLMLLALYKSSEQEFSLKLKELKARKENSSRNKDVSKREMKTFTKKLAKEKSHMAELLGKSSGTNTALIKLAIEQIESMEKKIEEIVKKMD